jgi:hypothetical protein
MGEANITGAFQRFGFTGLIMDKSAFIDKYRSLAENIPPRRNLVQKERAT